MKRCKTCEQELVETEFYRHPKTADKLAPSCKACTKAFTKANREKNIERIRAYDRERGHTPKRKAAVKAYQQTDKGKAARQRVGMRWATKNPIKRAAHIMVNNAVRDGRLVKQPCEECGALDVEAHHDDYFQPLKVRWLCITCHDRHHQEHGTNEPISPTGRP